MFSKGNLAIAFVGAIFVCVLAIMTSDIKSSDTPDYAAATPSASPKNQISIEERRKLYSDVRWFRIKAGKGYEQYYRAHKVLPRSNRELDTKFRGSSLVSKSDYIVGYDTHYDNTLIVNLSHHFGHKKTIKLKHRWDMTGSRRDINFNCSSTAAGDWFETDGESWCKTSDRKTSNNDSLSDDEIHSIKQIRNQLKVLKAAYSRFHKRTGDLPKNSADLKSSMKIERFVADSPYIDDYEVFYDHTAKLHLNHSFGLRTYVEAKPKWNSQRDQFKLVCHSNIDEKFLKDRGDRWCNSAK